MMIPCSRVAISVLGALLFGACVFDPVAGIAPNTNDNDNTNTNSNTRHCGDGVISPGEDCDGQNLGGQDCISVAQGFDGGKLGCLSSCRFDTSQCTSTNCGNNVVDSGEECDDGNAVNTDACLNNCRAATCGDGQVRENHESCDDGGQDTSGCDADCTLPVCGDGHVNQAAGEQCDSSGQDTSDCNADCTLPVCGDGHVNQAAGEQCDSSGQDTSDCNADCTLPVCGDGHVNQAAGEQCDDANITADDGCNTSCRIEDFFGCSPDNPSECHCVVYVDQSLSNPDQGQSWSSADDDLTDAVARASNFVQDGEPFCDVWVVQGTYDLPSGINLADHVHMYGGFASGDRWYDDRTLPANASMLDGKNSADSVVTAYLVVDARLDGFEVTAGVGSGYGGGLWLKGQDIVLANCIIRDNVAHDNGGGVYVTWNNDGVGPTDVKIIRTILARNHADKNGGGLCVFSKSHVTLQDVLLVGNSADVSGFSVASLGDSDSQISCINCTATPGGQTPVTANFRNGGQGRIAVINSILWGPSNVTQLSGSVSVRYSDVRNISGLGPGNIDADPLFAGPSNDFQLAPSSPCIDAADGDAASSADILGRPRHDDATADSGTGTPTYVDMGAFERQ
ncbi:MAG: hypothetical protein J7M25_02435 [Deltaproteobacteria bacterium]|nr:hypothetical protein [Deltaproteobacteria bacterium]